MMAINGIAAIIAGLGGTAVMTGMMLVGGQLNLPAIDVQGILGRMQHAERSSSLGYIMHFVLGAVFALGYALVFALIPVNILALGPLLGIVHWLAVGWMFAF